MEKETQVLLNKRKVQIEDTDENNNNNNMIHRPPPLIGKQ